MQTADTNSRMDFAWLRRLSGRKSSTDSRSLIYDEVWINNFPAPIFSHLSYHSLTSKRAKLLQSLPALPFQRSSQVINQNISSRHLLTFDLLKLRVKILQLENLYARILGLFNSQGDIDVSAYSAGHKVRNALSMSHSSNSLASYPQSLPNVVQILSGL